LQGKGVPFVETDKERFLFQLPAHGFE